MRRVRLGCVVLLATWLMTACSAGDPGGTETSPTIGSTRSAATSPSPSAAVPFQITEPTPSMDPVEADGIEASIFSGYGAANVVAAFGSIWVSNHHSNSVTRIDPKTNELIDRIHVGIQPGGMLAALDSVWVVNYGANTVSRIDPATNTSVAIETGDGLTCGDPVLADGLIWVSHCDDGFIAGLDPDADSVIRTLEVTGFPASDGSDLWLFSEEGIARVDPSTGDVVAELQTGSEPFATSASFAGGNLWFRYLADASSDGRVGTIDLATNETRTVARVGSQPTAPLVDRDTVWVMSAFDETISRIDASNHRIATDALPPVEGELFTVAFGSIWVPDFTSGYVYRISLPDRSR